MSSKLDIYCRGCKGKGKGKALALALMAIKGKGKGKAVEVKQEPISPKKIEKKKSRKFQRLRRLTSAQAGELGDGEKPKLKRKRSAEKPGDDEVPEDKKETSSAESSPKSCESGRPIKRKKKGKQYVGTVTGKPLGLENQDFL